MNAGINAYTNAFLNDINPYIRMAMYSTIAPYHQLEERVIYDYEIVLFKSGHATITIEDQRYEAGPGDLFFLKPGQRHSFAVHDEPLVQPHIHFDLYYSRADSAQIPISFKAKEDMTPAEQQFIRSDVTNFFFDEFPSCIRLRNTLYIEQLLFDVINVYQAPSVFPELQLKWRFLRLLDHLLCEIGWRRMGHSMHKDERVQHIRLYLERYTDRHVTLDELAQVHHMDRSYVSRIFRQQFGIPPVRYHLLLRIQKARQMICFTNLSLTAIAKATGFASLQDFSRTFRRTEGTAPSALRK